MLNSGATLNMRLALWIDPKLLTQYKSLPGAKICARVYKA